MCWVRKTRLHFVDIQALTKQPVFAVLRGGVVLGVVPRVLDSRGLGTNCCWARRRA